MNGESNTLALSVFGVVLAVTFAVTYWAARRTRTATEYLVAGRGITGAQNGFAIAGDFLSAATFLGIAGLVFLYGFDGTIIPVAAIMSFVPVMLILAERMRNTGKFTMADVLAFRLRERPTRAAAAVTTLAVTGFYLMAQLLGAGVLMQALAGVDFSVAVVLTGTLMLVYVIFGGMLATTWVQIIKAGLLMVCGIVLTVVILSRVGFSISGLFARSAGNHPAGADYLVPGLQYGDPLDVVSFGMTFVLGTAGLPHILMRFFTVPDAKAARTSVVWAVGLIGSFFLMTIIIGLGARALLDDAGVRAAGESGNLAGPALAAELGGGIGSTGGGIALALISAVAFATILAVVAGLVITSSGAVAHDIWNNVVRRGRSSDREVTLVARISAVAVGIVAMVLTVWAGPSFNITFLVGLALSVAASANFPALVMALTWRRFNTAGVLTGLAFGLVSSLVLILLSPTVYPGESAPWPYAYPSLLSVPLGFLGCWLGSLLAPRDHNEREFAELLVRAETGYGAEGEATSSRA
ncbi:MAG: solute symporter family protein [Actinophytocola sp.]|uniref:solute symporter family protein n=1 Tax=Actinophytocola sp. TaxID=1872138 RepID=UPI003D6A2C05